MFMFGFIDKSMKYFSHHVILNSVAHTAGGFGLALVLQHYMQGHEFISVWFGWGLIALSFIIHIKSMMKETRGSMF
ncbi:MAG TPA: hypothetical protein VFF04_06290 [Candidatus Babeliales bacterium]|nr:hypothetical protein [Candidatus Babeliales bacterium]